MAALLYRPRQLPRLIPGIDLQGQGGGKWRTSGRFPSAMKSSGGSTTRRHCCPGKQRWMTIDEDVRRIEELLGMPEHTIRAPLWVSGDVRSCQKCDREVNWLDIVSSALERVHDGKMIASVILGKQKYVNVEAPDAIQGLRCFDCKTPFERLRSSSATTGRTRAPPWSRSWKGWSRPDKDPESGRYPRVGTIGRTNPALASPLSSPPSAQPTTPIAATILAAPRDTRRSPTGCRTTTTPHPEDERRPPNRRRRPPRPPPLQPHRLLGTEAPPAAWRDKAARHKER